MRRASGRRTFAAAITALAGLSEVTAAADPASPDPASPGAPPRRWSIEARLGNAWNAPLPARIRQPGETTLEIDPRWRTRGFEFPLYYGVRIARGGPRAAWALDLIHHKLFLENPPSEVGRFSISHGYNLLTVQRLTERGPWMWGGALGLVIAHPESEIRGRRFDERRGLFRDGYFIAGPTVAALGGYSLEVAPGWSIAAESRLTFSHAEVPVSGGYARVPNLAWHGALGLRRVGRWEK